MKHLTLIILLALAPLSWGYKFSDGTKFRGDVDSYMFLRCTEINPRYGRAQPYVRFYAIFLQKKRAYVADNDSKEWIKLSPQIEENKIFFQEPIKINSGYQRSFGWMNRTTLVVWHPYGGKETLACGRSTFDMADSWLEITRNARKI